MTAKTLTMDKQDEDLRDFNILKIIKTRKELKTKAGELYELVSNDKLIKLWNTIYSFVFRNVYKTIPTNIKNSEGGWRDSGTLCLMDKGLGWRRENSGTPYTYRVTYIQSQFETVYKYGAELVPYFKEVDRIRMENLHKWVTENYELIKGILESSNPTPNTVLEIDKEITNMFGEKARIEKMEYKKDKYGRSCDYREIRICADKDITDNSSYTNSSLHNPKINVSSNGLADSYLYFVLRNEITEFLEKCKEELSVLGGRVEQAIKGFEDLFQTALILNAL